MFVAPGIVPNTRSEYGTDFTLYLTWCTFQFILAPLAACRTTASHGLTRQTLKWRRSLRITTNQPTLRGCVESHVGRYSRKGVVKRIPSGTACKRPSACLPFVNQANFLGSDYEKPEVDNDVVGGLCTWCDKYISSGIMLVIFAVLAFQS